MNKKGTLILVIFLTSILLVFTDCSRRITKLDKSREMIFYPAPPDTARIQFLTGITNSTQITGKQTSFAKFLFGETPAKEIVKPYGIAIHGSKIYICDTGLGLIIIIDLDKNSFDYFIPKGLGQLMLPLNCAVDNEGNLYVADGNRKQVVIFDELGNYLDAIGEPDKFKPTDVYVWDSKIWIANSKENKVIVYNKATREMLYSFPDAKVGDASFLYTPTNIFVTDEAIYVSDIGDSKIKKYTHEGELISSIGSYGKNIGQFVRPKGIALDHKSNLYVVDAGFENVQLFDKDGKLLMFFGGSYEGPGDMWLPAKVTIDYDNLKYFQKYVDPKFKLEYLIFVVNQYGPDKIGVYGFVKPKTN